MSRQDQMQPQLHAYLAVLQQIVGLLFHSQQDRILKQLHQFGTDVVQKLRQFLADHIDEVNTLLKLSSMFNFLPHWQKDTIMRKTKYLHGTERGLLLLRPRTSLCFGYMMPINA